MKIIYITAQTPWGRGETFILEEMLEVKRQGINLLIIPRNPPKEIFHKETKRLLENSIWLPLINLEIIINFLGSLFTKISIWKVFGTIFFHSRNPWIFLKNLAVFSKSIFVAKIIKRENIGHIHAHWGSTTATMAYIVSKMTGIPWSLTLHRWDIVENNFLNEKVKSAEFVRIISKHGKKELLGIVLGGNEEKVKVLHVGVKIPESVRILNEKKESFSKFTIATPANLIETKGHKYLIEACFILVKQGIRNFQCIFYGGGPLKTELESLIRERELTNYIKMPGAIPHEKLIKMYRNKEIDMVVLPSIITKGGEHEGIPVALMEAMAYRIPVISTNTGGIPELLSNGAGIIVKEKSSEQLVESILKVMKEEHFQRELSEKGYQRIKEEFNVEKNVKALLGLIKISKD